MTLLILSIAILCYPLTWEILNDSEGEKRNQKALDVLIRCGLALIAAVIGWLLINKPIIDGFILSLAIHWLLFDYMINAILITRGIIQPRNGETWFSYMGSTAVTDRLKFWRNCSPWFRLGIKVVVLIIAILIYSL